MSYPFAIFKLPGSFRRLSLIHYEWELIKKQSLLQDSSGLVAVSAFIPEYVINNFNFQFVTFHRFSKKRRVELIFTPLSYHSSL